MADHANSTPAPDAIDRQKHLARAYLELEAAVAELHNMALVTDIIVAETMTMRAEARGCILSEDRADALEYAVGKLAALSLALNRTYSAAWREVA